MTTGGKFILFKNVEDRYMNVLDTYDTYDDAYEAMKEDVVQEVNDTFDEEIFDTYNVDDEDGEAEDYNVTVISGEDSTDNGGPVATATFCDDEPAYDWRVFRM